DVQRSDGSGSVVNERVDGQNYEASLGEGIYRWSVSNDAGQSYSRTFRLLQLPGLQVTRPLSGTKVTVNGESGLVLFSWEPFRLLQDYRLVLSKSQSLSPVLHTLDTSRTSAVLSLEPGQYYWQLKAIGEIPGQKESGNPQTSIMPLEVKAQELEKREVTVSLKDNQKEKTTPPVLPRQTPAAIYPIYPGPGATIDMSNKDSILFRWTAMPGVQTYLFRMYRNDAILMETSLSRPYLNFTELTLLDTAWFEWSVEPIFGDGKSGSGFQQKFRITLSQTLEKPELEN
ncbi:MAG: hypothetical protein KDK33_19765, partial [Leptospiraceae bacterium]|nr:hypothetical protein [Leptospiraceae bacterium]